MPENRFDPMKEIAHLSSSVGRVIERGLQSVQSAANPSVPLRLDVYEIQDEIIIRTSPIDGLDPSSLDVAMEGEVLTFRGETKPEEVSPYTSYLLQERRFGPFSRSITIPVPVRSEEARAKVKNGVLTITIPIDRESR